MESWLKYSALFYTNPFFTQTLSWGRTFPAGECHCHWRLLLVSWCSPSDPMTLNQLIESWPGLFPCFLHLFKWYDESSLKWNYLRLILLSTFTKSLPPIRLEFLIQCLYSSQSRAWGFKAAGWSQTRECCRSQSCDGIYRQVHTSLCLTSSHAWQLTLCMEILIVQVL